VRLRVVPLPDRALRDAADGRNRSPDIYTRCGSSDKAGQSPEQYKDAIVAGTWVTIAAFLVAAAARMALPNGRGPGRRDSGYPIQETASRDAATATTPC
jgi:hypothetical protein